jgi:hypothetical protein
MNVNENAVDRGIRIVLGIVAIFAGIIFRSWWGVIGIPLLITGISGRCGLYTLLGFATKKKEAKPTE